MILHITTQMELIKLDKSIVQNRQSDGKITPWQLARIYIYTLPFANLDMILEIAEEKNKMRGNIANINMI